MKNVALHNLGCKVNAYETESMMQQLAQHGYHIVPFAPGADIYIVNTCTVTNVADRKSRQILHKAKKMNPSAVVVAAGCYVQTQENREALEETVDLVIGNNKKQELVTILNEYLRAGKREEAVLDMNTVKEYEELHLVQTAEHTRAYIKVQDGCNQFCSYCIIPYARGRVRSRKKEDVLEEVKRLAANGYREVVLTGIHLSSYGIDLEKENLLSLITVVHEIDGIERIRLGSLEPGIITDEFCRQASELSKLCPHFHLSLQSGCEETLKRMNRRYTASEYYKKCELLRTYFEHPAITTDVIVGFPGETEEEFAESREFIDTVGFYETHIFKYSRRKGTKAAVMKGQVEESVKQKRSRILQTINEKNKKQWLSFYNGKELEVLLEEQVEYQGVVYQTGHSKEYIKAAVRGSDRRENELLTVKVLDVEDAAFVLCGE